MIKYFFGLALMRQRRPHHMPAGALDRCIQLITEAWQARQSALIALALILLLWDGERGRGSKLSTLFKEACTALARTEPWRDEIDRFSLLMPADELTMPVETSHFRAYLHQSGESR